MPSSRCFVWANVALALLFAAQPGGAQVTASSQPIQPSANVVIPSATGSVTYPQYNIESGVSCPSAVINVSGFGGSVDTSTAYIDRFGSSGTYGNYGGALSLSVPLASREFVENCKKTAQAKAKKADLDTWNTLINNCAAFKQKGITGFANIPGIPEEFKVCEFVSVVVVPSGKSSGTQVEPSGQGPQLNIERFSPSQGGILQLVP